MKEKNDYILIKYQIIMKAYEQYDKEIAKIKRQEKILITCLIVALVMIIFVLYFFLDKITLLLN
jgi:cell division protein FtsL